MKISTEQGYSLFTTMKREFVRVVKVVCDIALDFGTEHKSTTECSDYKRPAEFPSSRQHHQCGR